MMMGRDARERPPTFVGAGGARREVGTQIPKTERSLNEGGAATDSGRRQLREGRAEGRGHLSRPAPSPLRPRPQPAQATPPIPAQVPRAGLQTPGSARGPWPRLPATAAVLQPLVSGESLRAVPVHPRKSGLLTPSGQTPRGGTAPREGSSPSEGATPGST